MREMLAVFRREFAAYFASPLAYVFIVIFLALAGAMTFFLGNFFARGQADLESFFMFHPWLYLFLVPAIAMRLWAEERKTGTIELLLTLPVSVPGAVIGKFLAAWAFTGVALALTFPMWITVGYLGRPDHGAIAAGYAGSFVLAGAYLAIGACVSALTRNQVIAFVVACAAAFVLTVSGTPVVLNFFSGWAPVAVIDAVASFSLLGHFIAIAKGVIDARDAVFFASLIAFALFANVVIVEWKKGA
jgi:ABC-2 type transport system permease protein